MAKRTTTVAGDSTAAKRVKVDAVKKANAMNLGLFEERFLDQASLTYKKRTISEDIKFDVEHFDAASLPSQDLEACFDLIKTTSRVDYEHSSIGWKPDHKKREMQDPLMHYFIVRRRGSIRSENKVPAQRGLVEGFLSFMLTYDSRPYVPVAYIYEVHLAETVRRLGLGTKLLDLCHAVALRVGVLKVMLTCFLDNENAHQFYKQHGYDKDPISPDDRKTRTKVVKIDYVIMSKPLAIGDD